MWIDSQICGCLNDSFLISLRSMLEKIKVDLPHYPDQVIQDWLVPFAKSAQWPPQKGTRWVNIFPNKNISLDFWREVGWKKKRVLIDDMRLTDQSKSFIHHMYRAYCYGDENYVMRNIRKRGKDRFNRILEYVIAHGLFPKPIVLLEESGGMSILDGHHRMLAYVLWRDCFQLPEEYGAKERMQYVVDHIDSHDQYRKSPSVFQDVWIGKRVS